MRIAIIGAGASGLVMGRHIKTFCSEFDIYERRNCIGGNWRDRESPGSPPDEDMIACSPLYDLLRTNTPVDSVTFDGLNYDTEECFIHWTDVNKYLKDYANKFGLTEHIFLDTEVFNVSWTDNEWRINFRNNLNGEIDEKYYNFVIVCNGHEEYPNIPDYEGLSEFKGIKLHSKRYRNPKHYKNQRVLVIGVGPSGSDIALQLLSEADTVYFSHHHEDFSDGRYPANLIQKPDVKKFNNNSVIFEDDTECEIDAVIFCTGYVHNIDFIDKSCGVELGEKYIRNLYKQMFSIEHPSLIFIGYPRLFFIFPLIEWQAKLAIKIVSGQVALPSKEEMYEDTKAWEQNHRNEGKKERQFFELKTLARDYMRGLSEVGRFEYPPEALFDMFNTYFYQFKNHPTVFKKHFYKIVNSEFIFKPCSELNSH
ncbi:hypothetical protein O3M35_001743 [Rhynocoris fuscipes]|uniref:Flavin-containing monooxygenase n=1 Tax=Rhynocoris fuscipes TaxID=488301 RepID=A0AAW1CNJ7_9HEMI